MVWIMGLWMLISEEFDINYIDGKYAGFQHAVKLRKEMPRLGVGVHLTLTWQTTPQTVDTLIESGEFRSLSYYQHPFNIDKDQLYQEWNAQIQNLSCGDHTNSFRQSSSYSYFGWKSGGSCYISKIWFAGSEQLWTKDEVRHVDYFEPCFDVVGETDEKTTNQYECGRIFGKFTHDIEKIKRSKSCVTQRIWIRNC